MRQEDLRALRTEAEAGRTEAEAEAALGAERGRESDASGGDGGGTRK